MLDEKIVTAEIEAMHLGDFSTATIRDIQALSKALEAKTGEPVIHLEMGVPGLQPSQIALQAEQEALANGCATIYPPNGGIPRIKQAASDFVKAFIGVDIAPEGCVPTTGSMQGTFATFTAIHHAFAGTKQDTVLLIQPGFPVQTTQCDVIGLKHEALDIYNYRGNDLITKLEEIVSKGNICAVVYSNPNNPSWVCFTEEELKGIGHIATKYDILVLEDLAYFAMDFRQNLSVPFEAPYQPTVGRYTDNYMLLISGSKAFSYAGERIGVVCISDKLFHRHFDDLAARYEGLPFGLVFSTRMLYALSSGTSHSAQYAMAAMLKAASDGSYDFRKEVSVYGERAHKLKEIFCRHGFHIVYDKDLDQPVADGFYFTIGYKQMTSGELAKELMYYGVSAICLITTGSHQEGLRVCTSFIEDHQYAQLEERMTIFEQNNP